VARRQGALAWELRAAMSLAQLWQGHGRAQEARTLLSGVAQRFTEGHATADLRQAAALLAGTPPVTAGVAPSLRREVRKGRR